MMQMNKGSFRDTQVLTPASVAEMRRPQADLYTTMESSYGLTFFIDTYKGLRRVWHDGGISSFVSHFRMIPEANTAVIVLFNRGAGNFMKFVRQIFDQILGLPRENEQPRAIEPDRSLWSRYAGTYLGPYAGLATIEISDDQLTLDFNGQNMPLQARRDDLYFFSVPESEQITSVGFIPEEDGTTRYIMVNSNVCERVERDPAFAPDPANWSTLTGTYTGEIGKWEVRLEGNQLFIVIKKGGDETKILCTPLSNTCFAGGFGVIEFSTTEDGVGPVLEVGRTFKLMRTSS
jgi:Domain of unknown function (DUF3471)